VGVGVGVTVGVGVGDGVGLGVGLFLTTVSVICVLVGSRCPDRGLWPTTVSFGTFGFCT
jgi:hypothetical protein